ILDASAAHRCKEGWVYGLPEIAGKETIANAQYLANPGCFATACVLAAWPLPRTTMAFHGVTGYSAGGKKAIDNPTGKPLPRLAQFGFEHRHLPEIAMFGRVTPVLTTMVGNWRDGMLVQTISNSPTHIVLNQYKMAYRDHDHIQVLEASESSFEVDPQSCNGTNQVKIVVAEQPYNCTAIAVVLDNLGKGAAGAAAQNIKLMLGQ